MIGGLGGYAAYPTFASQTLRAPAMMPAGELPLAPVDQGGAPDAASTVVSLSKEGRAAAGLPADDRDRSADTAGQADEKAEGAAGSDEADETNPNSPRSPDGKPLTEEEQAAVKQLAERDREVRAHEMAHMVAGSGLVTSGASYSYEVGPDGKRYAIGGEVGIDISPGRTPEETLRKAQQINAAALAPAEPSPQDRQVAAQAQRMAAQARAEMAAAEQNGGTNAGSNGASTRGSGNAAGAYGRIESLKVDQAANDRRAVDLFA